MFAPIAYIAWANQFYGKVRHDFASSGIPNVGWSEVTTDPVDVDAIGAWPSLREAVARYNDVAVAEVCPAMGTSHAIFLAYAAMLSPGDEILVEHPTYEPLVRAAEGLGVTVRTFPRRPEVGFALEPDRIGAMLGPRTRAVVVSSLQNPTGVRADAAALREIATILEARDGFLLVDEVYAPFDELPADGVFARSARKIAANIVAIGSLTKCYGLGMHRLGWVLGPAPLVERAANAMTATVGHTPLPWAAHGVVAFRELPKLARRATQLFAGKRTIVERWIATVPGASWSAPESGLFGLVTIAGAGDLRSRIEILARTHGVLVGAGSFFGVPESFRLAWAVPTATALGENLLHLATLSANFRPLRRR